jgi:hypothetical protein
MKKDTVAAMLSSSRMRRAYEQAVSPRDILTLQIKQTNTREGQSRSGWNDVIQIR